MPAPLKLDKFREKLIELKDTMSAEKIADYLMENYSFMATGTDILNWYRRNGLSKSIVKSKTHTILHGAGGTKRGERGANNDVRIKTLAQ